MKNNYKKAWLACAMMAGLAGMANAQESPTAVSYSDYTGDSFIANWSGADPTQKCLLSVFEKGERQTVSEDFSKINQTNGKIDQANPNYPAGWVVSVSDAGTTDMGFDGTKNRLMLDATGDYVLTKNIITGNVDDFVVTANLANAEGVTVETSSLLFIKLYDHTGQALYYGQIQTVYFASAESLSLKEAFGGFLPSDLGFVEVSITKDGTQNVGDLLIKSLSYTCDKPKYIIEAEPVEGTSRKVENLDPEKVYWYYVQGENGGVKSAISQIEKVDGFLKPTVAAATEITPTSYTANWQRLPKAVGYTVQNYLFETATESGVKQVLAENFDKCTEGTVDQPVGVSDPDPYTDAPGWGGRNIIMADGMLGANAGQFPRNMSYLRSPEMNLAANQGKYKIRIKAHGTAGDLLSVYRVDYMIDTNGDGIPDALNIHKSTFDQNGVIDETWEMNDGAEAVTLSFEESKMKRFFIDEISITQEIEAGTVTKYAREKVEIDDPQTTSYTFTGLEENGQYGFEVTGIRYGDYNSTETSEPSDIQMVELTSTGIGSEAATGMTVTFNGNTVSIALDSNAPITLYTADGKAVMSVAGKAGVNDITMPARGMYILKAGGKTFKVVAR